MTYKVYQKNIFLLDVLQQSVLGHFDDELYLWQVGMTPT